MGELILSGGGNAEQSSSINSYFAETIDQKKPLLYIPIAGDPSFRPYQVSFEYIKSMFAPYGIIDITMWTDLQSKTLEDLQTFSVVYISGGSAKRLFNTFTLAGFDKVLKQYIYQGGTVYGQSAGAMIFGEKIVHLEGDVDDELIGMDMLHPYSFCYHYNENDDAAIKDYVMKSKNSVVALSEGGALNVNETGTRLVGDGCLCV